MSDPLWSARIDQLPTDRDFKYALDLNSVAVSYAEVLRRWQCDTDFRTYFISLLAKAPYSAFRWETPPITAATAGRPFEFVLLDDPHLVRKPDPNAFAEHFKDAGSERGVVQFQNLGKDAIMVVPCPTRRHTAYRHLAA